MDVRKKGFSEYIRLDKAIELVLSNIEVLKSEKVSFDKSFRRVLAEDLESKVNVPPFDRSAMDGFAVRAEDTFGADENNPKELEIVTSIEIGSTPEKKIGEGEAAEIATGAPIPEGADATVMFEKTIRENSKIKILEPVSPGENVSPKGEDVEVGQTILEKNRRLKPSDMGLLASTNNLEISVRKRPEVGVAITGDELREAGESLEPGEIAETNSFTIGHAVERAGGRFERIGIVRDDLSEIKDVLNDASKFDLMILTGGSSVGEKDFVPVALDEVGELIFHGVAIRPGSPSAFGIVDDTPVFSLAGFPAAALIAFEVLVRPALRGLQGLSVRDFGVRVRAVLDRKISSALGRVDFVRVSFVEEDGEYRAEPLRVTGSSVLRSISEADGLVRVSEDSEGFSEGEEVTVFLSDL